MALSNDLISEFVEITNDQAENKQETTMYGTIRLHNGKRCVQIDGSEVLTPIKATVDAIPGDRVTVLVKDHSVIVNGSTSSPAARKAGLDAINDHIDAIFDDDGHIVDSKINVVESNINTINSEMIAIDSSLNTIQSDIQTIDSDVSTIRSNVQNIDTKVTNQGSTIVNIQSDIQTQGSDIDILNSAFTIQDGRVIGLKSLELEDIRADNATLTNLFVTTGILKDAIISQGKVTAELDAVTINASKITSGTIATERLILIGDDGILYKLNVEGQSVVAEETDENRLNGAILKRESLSGDKIVASSITAEKISVNDLVAFGATIGGLHIENNSLYSGIKKSVDSENEGIYFGSDGQFVMGNSQNYIKFIKDTDDNFRLYISADAVQFSSTGKSVEETISDALDDLSTVEDGLSKIQNEGVHTVTTDIVTIDGSGITVSEPNSEMETNINNDGMIISRNEEEVLVANNQGVDAKNLHATTYLIIGKNSRFEDWGNYTACFWIGD